MVSTDPQKLPPKSWMKHGEIFTDFECRSYLVCQICHTLAPRFFEGFIAEDAQSFWEHIQEKHLRDSIDGKSSNASYGDSAEAKAMHPNNNTQSENTGRVDENIETMVIDDDEDDAMDETSSLTTNKTAIEINTETNAIQQEQSVNGKNIPTSTNSDEIDKQLSLLFGENGQENISPRNIQNTQPTEMGMNSTILNSPALNIRIKRERSESPTISSSLLSHQENVLQQNIRSVMDEYVSVPHFNIPTPEASPNDVRLANYNRSGSINSWSGLHNERSINNSTIIPREISAESTELTNSDMNISQPADTEAGFSNANINTTYPSVISQGDLRIRIALSPKIKSALLNQQNDTQTQNSAPDCNLLNQNQDSPVPQSVFTYRDHRARKSQSKSTQKQNSSFEEAQRNSINENIPNQNIFQTPSSSHNPIQNQRRLSVSNFGFPSTEAERNSINENIQNQNIFQTPLSSHNPIQNQRRLSVSNFGFPSAFPITNNINICSSSSSSNHNIHQRGYSVAVGDNAPGIFPINEINIYSNVSNKDFTQPEKDKNIPKRRESYRPFKCPFCGITCKSPRTVRKHVHIYHDPCYEHSSVFDCDICKKRISIKKCARHMDMHNGVKRKTIAEPNKKK